MTKNANPVEPTAPQNVPSWTATAWYLTKIVSPTKDEINFNYTAFHQDPMLYNTYVNGITQEIGLDIARLPNRDITTAIPFVPVLSACFTTECLAENTYVEKTYNKNKFLSSISFSNGTVEFTTSYREDNPEEVKIDAIKVIRSDQQLIKQYSLVYEYATSQSTTYPSYGPSNVVSKRLYLKEVHEMSKNLQSAHKYKFTYDNPSELPPRLSFAQDRFGYFNGKTNSKFYPNDTWVNTYLAAIGSSYNNYMGGDRTFDFNYAKKGALTKIQYPTGGTTTFEYEPHRLATYTYEKLTWDSVKKELDTSSTYNQTVYSRQFTIYADTEIRLRRECSWASIIPPFPEEHAGYISIVDATTNIEVTGYPITVYPGTTMDNASGFVYFPAGTYKLKIVANKPHLRLKAKLEIIRHTVNNSSDAGLGGIRVKSIVDSSDEVTFFNRREFHYGDWNNPNISSGTGLNYPDGRHFVKFQRKTFLLPTNNMAYGGNNILTSSTSRNTYRNENGSICYTKVIELNESSTGNNGGIEYTFHADNKYNAEPLTTEDPHYKTQIPPYLLDGAPMTNYDFKNGIPDATKYFSYTTKFGNRQILKEVKNFYTVDELQVDTFYVVRHELDHGGADYDHVYLHFVEYGINRYYRYYTWVKLDKVVETNYSGSESLVNETNYTYSDNNYKVGHETHNLSDGTTRHISYRYPPDIGPSEADFTDYLNMTVNNMLDPVVQQYAYKDVNTKKEQRTYFDLQTFGNTSFYLPAIIKSKVNSNAEETELIVEQYDSKANILQYKARDGITNSIIWGYGGNYPVAKIQGATHSASIGVLNTSIVNSPSSDAALRTELNNLRTQLTSNPFVSTLTYDPLIGVTSETDVNGRTVYYEYDNFNRLKLVRDNDSKILKRFCYNFKGETTDCAETHTYPPTPCNTHNCNGSNRKCINGTCYTSTTRELVASEDLANGTWKCTYRYVFTVGMAEYYGDEFDEFQQTPFGCLEPL